MNISDLQVLIVMATNDQVHVVQIHEQNEERICLE